jgi:nucleoside-diphosphate-sugar epimerase
MDAVIHLAASVNHDDVAGCFTTNAVGTFLMLQACAENGVKRVLVASSINASGWFFCRVTDRPRDFPYLPVDEDVPTDHEDAYSLSKYVNELNCIAWSNRTGMTTAAFRFAGVFPPERTELTAERVEPTREWPETLAAYVDLRDVIRGLLKALECPTLPRSGVYQLVAADTLLPEPTLEIIERYRPDLLKRLRRPLAGHASMLSHERATQVFGYEPAHSWRTRR